MASAPLFAARYITQRTSAAPTVARCFSALQSSAIGSNTTVPSMRALQNHHHAIASSTSSSMQITATNLPRYFSTPSKETSGVRGWMERRREKKELEHYTEQMERLSDLDRFKLTDFQNELSKSLKGFTANIPFMQTKEIKAAKAISSCVGAMVKVLDEEAVADDLLNLTRLQRLQIADACDKTIEEVAFVISQIQNMDIMQKTLRRRRLEGKPLPADSQKMQEAIKKEAMNVMSPSQKEMVKKRQLTMAKQQSRRK